MERRRGWLSFKRSFLFPNKGVFLKVTSCLRHKTNGNGHELVSLYKDLESCAGYADIRVMWEMIHSSCPSTADTTRCSQRPSYWSLCFRPT